MRMIKVAVAGFALAAASLATAQATPPLKAGASVYDPSGAAIGTIESVDGTSAIVSTGTSKVAIPTASFGAGTNGPTLSATKADLDNAAKQAADQSRAAVLANLSPGTAVKATGGGSVVGTVKVVEGEFVTLTTAKGDVRLPTTAFASSTAGVTVAMSKTEFDAAVAAAHPG